MSFDLAQYRVIVGIFGKWKISRNLTFEEFPIWEWSKNFLKCDSICSSLLFYIFYNLHVFISCFYLSVLKITTKFCVLIFLLFNSTWWIWSFLVILSGDVEFNPRPKKKDKDCHSICHWNLNSLFAYRFSKLLF